MPKREYDPLATIPSAAAIRQRLDTVQRQARRLKILLRTAEQIERDRESSQGRDTTERKGVARARN